MAAITYVCAKRDTRHSTPYWLVHLDHDHDLTARTDLDLPVPWRVMAAGSSASVPGET